MTSPSLTVFPGLIEAATRKGHSMALALWHAARALDTVGEGRVLAANLKDFCCQFMRPANYWKALREAERIGLLTRIRRGVDGARLVQLRSLLTVARGLNVYSVGAAKVEVPLDSLSSAKSFKAALFNGWHAGRSHKTGQPISRATIRDLTGISRHTQRRYERGVTPARPNAMVVGRAEPDAIRGALEYHRENTHGACRVEGNLILRPLPNSYTSGLPTGSRSKARKVNRALRHGLVSTPAGQQRTFFLSARAAAQAARQGRAVDVPLAVAQGTTPPPGWQVGQLWAEVWDSWSLRWMR